jgi:N6-L-threonylcarbamoyladenine synthase
VKVLGIESSCDETAAALVTDEKKILSNVIYSQIEEHRRFGGVVPETAARAHLEKIDLTVESALEEAGATLSEVTAVAGTCGPGLIGGVIVGSVFARTLAMVLGIPFIAANHLEAHALSVRLAGDAEFPYLLLSISGGHCHTCIVRSAVDFKTLGKTLDDSVGESFDKIAKLLGLGYPGGPAVEKAAGDGDPGRFPLPRPLCRNGSLDFSFAGLKTAVRLAAEKCGTDRDKSDLCASFQRAVTDILDYKVREALGVCKGKNLALSGVAAAGGVAANRSVRAALQNICEQSGLRFYVPPPDLCTDNGAMVAWLGIEKLQLGLSDSLGFAPRPRWPLP